MSYLKPSGSFDKLCGVLVVKRNPERDWAGQRRQLNWGVSGGIVELEVHDVGEELQLRYTRASHQVVRILNTTERLR